MSEMVERVARAIAAAEGYDIDGLRAYVESSSVSKKDYERLMAKARAAIEAMREPDPKQIEAGFAKLDYDDSFGGDSDEFNKRVCGRVFTAMIDAAIAH